MAEKTRINWLNLVAPVLLLGALACVPLAAQALDNPFLIRLFTRVIVLSIAAVALNFVLGFGGLVSLMHAGLFGIGAYGVAILSHHGPARRTSRSPAPSPSRWRRWPRWSWASSACARAGPISS